MADMEKDVMDVIPEENAAAPKTPEYAADEGAGADVVSGADKRIGADEVKEASGRFAEKAQEIEDAVSDAASDVVSDAASDAVSDAASNDAAGAEKKTKKAGKTSKDVRQSIKNWVPGPQLPNQLTIARICMIPLFVILLMWVKKPAGNILAMIVFIVASLTDTADGYIARRYNYITTFGKFMDPLADKLLVCSALILLTAEGSLPAWVVIIIIAREFIISGFRLVAADNGIVIAARWWGKFKTVSQMLLCMLLILPKLPMIVGDAVITVLTAIVVLLTLISLIDYMTKNIKVITEGGM